MKPPSRIPFRRNDRPAAYDSRAHRKRSHSRKLCTRSSLNGGEVSLAADARKRMDASRAVIDRLVASGETAYGVNTGFGKMASVRISTDQIRHLQTNLVRSHACGVGASLSEPEVRAMMLLARQRHRQRLQRNSPRRCRHALRHAKSPRASR